jgi:site-specific recombinase XerD
MFDPASVRFRGPLSPYVGGFWSELIRQGYASYSARNLLYLVAHVSRWLENNGLTSSELTDARVKQFVTHRQRKGYTQYRTAHAVRPLLVYLRGNDLAPPPASPKVIAETPVDRLLREYAEYLVRERGLVSTTIRSRTDFARRFIGTRRGLDCKRITADQITSFVLHDFRCKSVGCCKQTVTGLRSLLRFLHVRGEIERDLTTCVPAVAHWRLSWLPKSLEPEQIERLLKMYESKSVHSCRDAAILRLLVRLGLRAGEVAALRLDDIDWRTGELVIHGKGRRESRLPLPHDVGRALVAYLRRGRPASTSRQLFLGKRAPFRPLTSHGVSAATSCALQRAGIHAGGAHVLRHTAATQMLRHGGSLDEIAQVLRHRHIDTTAIYAKVDHAALRTLAQPWPAGAA